MPVFGVYDFTEMHGGLGRLIGPLFLRGHEPAAASPLHMLPLPYPVTLLHGTLDTLVPHGQAVALAERWRSLGGTVQLISYEGLPHAFFNDARTDGCKAATRDLVNTLAKDWDGSGE